MVDQLSSFEVMRLVKDMSALEGAFLQKVYSPIEGLMVFRFNTKAGRLYLVHRVGKWAYLAEDVDIDLEPLGVSKGAQLPGFVRLLRQHLSNGFVTMVRQTGFDRIIEISIRKDLPHVIVLEMFGEGNVILTKQGTIVGCLRTQAWRHRVIRGGVEYKPPPPRKDPRAIQLAELAVLLRQSNADLVRTLATAVNLGGIYAEEVCQRSRLDKNMMANAVDANGYRAIREAIDAITTEVAQGTRGYLHGRRDGGRTVAAIRLASLADDLVESFPDLGQSIQAAHPLIEELEERAGPSDIQELLDRLRHQLSQQEEALGRFRAEVEASTAKAEAIYVNYKAIETLLEQVSTLREAKGWDAVREAFPDMDLDPAVAKAILHLSSEGGDRLEVEIDLRLSVNENATVYYERAKFLKDKIAGAEVAIVGTRREIGRVEEVRDREEAEEAEGRAHDAGLASRRTRKRFWFESNRWFVSSDGNVIIGGKDASGNRKVVKKYLGAGDRYIHADIHGASSIVVKAADVDGSPMGISEATLEEACHYAVCFSKAWSSRIGSGEAYWVTPEQVSTTPQSGEFLPKGGFIIRGKRNYVRNLGLELGIGLIDLGGTELVMCAPVTTMERRSVEFVRLVPSKGKKSDVAKALASRFSVLVEEVESVLPPGGTEVVED